MNIYLADLYNYMHSYNLVNCNLILQITFSYETKHLFSEIICRVGVFLAQTHFPNLVMK